MGFTWSKADVRCSEAVRINGVGEMYGGNFNQGGRTFDRAVFRLSPNSRWARFEIVAPDGTMAWVQPF